MFLPHYASDQEVAAVADTAQRCVGSSWHAFGVEIHRHVLELGPLKFQDRGRVAWSERVINMVAMICVAPRRAASGSEATRSDNPKPSILNLDHTVLPFSSLANRSRHPRFS